MIADLLSKDSSRKLREFRQDTRGVSIIEFAFALPFLILLYVGGFQLTDAISVYRKVTSATRTIADLTSQCKQVTQSDLQVILDASQQLMAPYSLANAKLTVSQIVIDSSGNATVGWSKGKNTNGLVEGASFAMPANIKQNGTSLIVGEMIYDYQPAFAASYIGSIPMTDRIMMSPRQVNTIPRGTVACDDNG